MVSQSVTVTNPIGLHARPAAEFVKVSSRLGCHVWIEQGHKKVNAKSILAVISLGAEQHSEVIITTDGEGEEEALKTLINFIEELEG